MIGIVVGVVVVAGLTVLVYALTWRRSRRATAVGEMASGQRPKPNPAPPAASDSDKATALAALDPQRRIAADVRTILVWVTFFGIVLILGMIGGCVVLVWRWLE